MSTRTLSDRPVTDRSLHDRVVLGAVLLAAAAALAYVLIGLGVLGVGDLTEEESPAGITYVAAAGYLLGGSLIMLRRRWLWVTGIVLNGLILLMFFTSYADRSSVLLSAGGVTTKAAQVLLELALVNLVATSGLRGGPRRTPDGT